MENEGAFGQKYAIVGIAMSTARMLVALIVLLLIENSRSCAGKQLHNNRLWLCSREFATLKGVTRQGGAPSHLEHL